MIRQLLTLATLFCFWGCNNNEKERHDLTQQISHSDKLLLDSIAKFPDSLLLKERLIQSYRDNDDYENAIAVTDDFLRTDSLNPRLWDIKATLYFENEDTIRAIRSLETALQILQAPAYIMKLGSIYARTKNNKALAMADMLLQGKFAHTEAEAFYIKGLYYEFAGEKTKAIGLFDRSLSVDYNYMPAYLEKAMVFYDSGKYDEALKVLNRAVTLQNRFDEGHYWRGRCLEKLDKPGEALEEYRMALMYSTDYTEAKEALERLQEK